MQIGRRRKREALRKREGLSHRRSEVVVVDGVVKSRISELAAEVLEDGPVEGAKCGAYHGLVVEAVSQAEARRNVGFRSGDIQRTGDAVEAGRQQGSGVGVDAAVNIGGDGQRRLVLVAKSQIQREPGRNLPVVLEENAEVVVTPAGGWLGLLILGRLDFAQQQIRNLRVWSCRSLRDS